MTSEGVGVALAGYGHWGRNYARILSELEGCRFVGVCESDPTRLRQALGRYKVKGWADFESMLDSSEVDAIVVSTPATTHYALTATALGAGRHVLVEKPMALEVAECERLCEMAEKTHLVLMVGFTFLYNPGIRKMKECVESPEFGRMYYLHTTRTNLGPIRHDVSAVWDLAPHDVSILDFLVCKEPKWASAVGACVLHSGRDDIAFITLGYADGIVGNIHVSWADPNKVREVVAVGSRRRVVFDDLNDLEKVRIFEKGIAVGESVAESFGEFKLLVRDGDIISPKIQAAEPLKNLGAHFLDCIVHNKRPLSDGQRGLAVVRAMCAIDKSVAQKGAPVEVV